jgi:hypothetical protein
VFVSLTNERSAGEEREERRGVQRTRSYIRRKWGGGGKEKKKQNKQKKNKKINGRMNADSGWKVELLLGCHDNPIK